MRARFLQSRVARPARALRGTGVAGAHRPMARCPCRCPSPSSAPTSPKLSRMAASWPPGLITGLPLLCASTWTHLRASALRAPKPIAGRAVVRGPGLTVRHPKVDSTMAAVSPPIVDTATPNCSAGLLLFGGVVLPEQRFFQRQPCRCTNPGRTNLKVQFCHRARRFLACDPTVRCLRVYFPPARRLRWSK